MCMRACDVCVHVMCACVCVGVICMYLCECVHDECVCVHVCYFTTLLSDGSREGKGQGREMFFINSHLLQMVQERELLSRDREELVRQLDRARQEYQLQHEQLLEREKQVFHRRGNISLATPPPLLG